MVVMPPSELRLTSIVLATGGVATITWTAEIGRSYLVEYATDLIAPQWTRLARITATEPTASFSYSPGEPAQRFYRIRLE